MDQLSLELFVKISLQVRRSSNRKRKFSLSETNIPIVFYSFLTKSFKYVRYLAASEHFLVRCRCERCFGNFVRRAGR